LRRRARVCAAANKGRPRRSAPPSERAGEGVGGGGARQGRPGAEPHARTHARTQTRPRPHARPLTQARAHTSSTHKNTGTKKKTLTAPPPRGRPADAVELRDDRFARAKDGATVHVKAVNWFGFNNRQTALDGLYSGGSAAGSDLASITWQLRLLGFNGVRLPFLFDDVLRRAPATGALLSWCDPTTPQALAARAVDPDASEADRLLARSQRAPVPPVPLPRAGGDDVRCNSYLPSSSTLDRLLWVVQWFAANGFYVLLDYHPMGLEYTSYDTRGFVGNWTTLWRAVSCLPDFQADLRGRVFLDLLNEPDSIGQRWEAQQAPPGGHPGPAAGLADLYLTAMDALWAMTPGAPIFFVEGGGQTGLRGVNWGNGFATDRAAIARSALSDPNPFFERLLAKPYRRSVVISPHVYGPSVTTAQDTYSGPEFVKMLDTSFGYLSKTGYCAPAVEVATGRRLLDAEDEAAVAAAAAEAAAEVAAIASAAAEAAIKAAEVPVASAAAAAAALADVAQAVAATAGSGTAVVGNDTAAAAAAPDAPAPAAAADADASAVPAPPRELPPARLPRAPRPSPAPGPPADPPSNRPPRGAAVSRDCQRFPVAVGEFGSRFEDPRDLEHLAAFAAYLNNEGAGRTDAHNAIGSWAYWSYNPNSWDTGGLVDDSWQNLVWEKLRFLRKKLGLRPWYAQQSAAAPPPPAPPGGQGAEDRARELQAQGVEREWWAAGAAAAPKPQQAQEQQL